MTNPGPACYVAPGPDSPKPRTERQKKMTNPHLQAQSQAYEDRYAPPSEFVAAIKEIKHGEKQNGTPYTVFELRVVDVLDQGLPRDPVNEDQNELEPGEVVTVFRDYMYDSGIIMAKNGMAAVIGSKLGRDVKPSALVPDPKKSNDTEACQVYLDSFDVIQNGKLKQDNTDYFQGVKIRAVITNATDKDGNAKKFTDFEFSRVE